MQTLYTVSQAAEILRKSPTATRRLADAMAEALPDYRPVTGKARQFTDNDLRTLLALSARLSANPALTQSALLAGLSDPSSEPLIILDTLPSTTPQEAIGSHKPTATISEALHPTRNALAPFLAAQDATQRQIAELSAQVERMELKASQPAPARPLQVSALVSVGIVFVSIIAAALVWPAAGLVGLAIVGAVLVWGIYSSSMRR